jgi:hypothetical protein
VQTAAARERAAEQAVAGAATPEQRAAAQRELTAARADRQSAARQQREVARAGSPVGRPAQLRAVSGDSAADPSPADGPAAGAGGAPPTSATPAPSPAAGVSLSFPLPTDPGTPRGATTWVLLLALAGLSAAAGVGAVRELRR